MVLGQTPGSVQMAMAGAGVWTAAGDVAGNIGRWFAEVLSKVSVPEVSPLLLRLSLGTLWLHSDPAGGGSDIVPGRDLDAMFALNAQMLAGQGVKIEPGATSVNLSVRGQLVNSNGQLALELLKTGNDALPAAGTGVEPVYVMLNDPLDSGRFTRKQLDRKYLKHANDFGINDTKKNRETLTKFRDAIEAHLADKGTVEKGTYFHEKESKVFFNPKTNNVVILKKNGDFISGWHLTVGTPQYEVYIKTGNLK